jgi:hypothetical protein
LIFIFALLAIRRVQDNQVRLELNGTHQPLVYADDVNMLDGNTNTMRKKSEEALLEACKEGDLEVNTIYWLHPLKRAG